MALTRAQERAVRVGGCGGLTPWREDLPATQFRHCPARGEPRGAGSYVRDVDGRVLQYGGQGYSRGYDG